MTHKTILQGAPYPQLCGQVDLRHRVDPVFASSMELLFDYFKPDSVTVHPVNGFCKRLTH
jgi:hypothetical protein